MVCLPCAIELLDTSTGELVGFEDDDSIWLDDDFVNDYMWAEGNWACDCNRHLFFYRAQGREPNDDRPCGEGRYLARATRLDTGDVVFDEIDGE
jgi:hypothetical protein